MTIPHLPYSSTRSACTHTHTHSHSLSHTHTHTHTHSHSRSHKLTLTHVLQHAPRLPSGFEEGSYLRCIDFLSLNSRLESNQEEDDVPYSSTRSACQQSLGFRFSVSGFRSSVFGFRVSGLGFRVTHRRFNHSLASPARDERGKLVPPPLSALQTIRKSTFWIFVQS